MNFRAVFHLISYLCAFTGAGQLVSWAVARGYSDPVQAQSGLLLSALLALVISFALWWFTRGPIDLKRRDGFGIVTFGWLSVAQLGALPYLFTGAISDPAAALFESMSGFTATGSTILTTIETLPRGILFWRSLTQWYGGMGIIVLAVAILPFLGVGGMQLFSAEMSGPSKDRLTPRIESTAKLLWGVYLLLTAGAFAGFRLAGLDNFDAINHAFTAAATGGFSTRDASIAAYNSLQVELVFVIVMLLGGISFPLHYRAITGRPLNYFRDAQFRFYLAVWALATGLVALNLYRAMGLPLGQSLRDSLFQVTTMATSTGYVSADYDQWPAFSRFILLCLMVVGGCAGSTAGGMKMIRVFVLLKKGLRELLLFIRPAAILQVKVGRKSVSPDILSKVTSYFIIYMLVWTLGTLAMTAYAPDLESAFSSVVTALGNMGPGFGTVGAVRNFAHIETGGKLVLTLMMLLGRLEFYTVLVLLVPGFWKR